MTQREVYFTRPIGAVAPTLVTKVTPGGGIGPREQVRTGLRLLAASHSHLYAVRFRERRTAGLRRQRLIQMVRLNRLNCGMWPEKSCKGLKIVGPPLKIRGSAHVTCFSILACSILLFSHDHRSATSLQRQSELINKYIKHPFSNWINCYKWLWLHFSCSGELTIKISCIFKLILIQKCLLLR